MPRGRSSEYVYTRNSNGKSHRTESRKARRRESRRTSESRRVTDEDEKTARHCECMHTRKALHRRVRFTGHRHPQISKDFCASRIYLQRVKVTNIFVNIGRGKLVLPSLTTPKRAIFQSIKNTFAGTPRRCVQENYGKRKQQQQRKPRENQ